MTVFVCVDDTKLKRTCALFLRRIKFLSESLKILQKVVDKSQVYFSANVIQDG